MAWYSVALVEIAARIKPRIVKGLSKRDVPELLSCVPAECVLELLSLSSPLSPLSLKPPVPPSGIAATV